jgi:hypothetical protein
VLKALEEDKSEPPKSLMYQPIQFERAAEPTDIIWENRHFTWWNIFIRELIAYSVIVIVLMLSFWGIYAIAHESIEVAAIFPPVNCTTIEHNYGDQL